MGGGTKALLHLLLSLQLPREILTGVFIDYPDRDMCLFQNNLNDFSMLTSAILGSFLISRRIKKKYAVLYYLLSRNMQCDSLNIFVLYILTRSSSGYTSSLLFKYIIFTFLKTISIF